MLRWNMHFPTNSARAYLDQLAALGAILAIPVDESGPEPKYKIVRNLRARPARLLTEDLSKIQRIYWIDDKPESVSEVMAELGHGHLRPSRFVAFMPVKLENKLFEMEKRYYKRKYRRKTFDEDDIYETRFRVVPGGGGYTPVLVSMKLKRGG
jgi:hypothetical protein